MAEKTFGTLVVQGLQLANKVDLSNPTTSNTAAHQVRQAIIDAIAHYRGREFLGANQAVFSYTPTAGQASFKPSGSSITLFSGDDDGKTDAGGIRVTRIIELWYDDSSDYLYPVNSAHSFESLKRHFQNFGATNYSHLIEYCWHDQHIWVSPPPDATFDIHVSCIYDPSAFLYRWDGEEWVYSVDSVDLKEEKLFATALPLFTELGVLFVRHALADLYAGTWDDAKGLKQAKWRALAADEEMRLTSERDSMRPKRLSWSL